MKHKNKPNHVRKHFEPRPVRQPLTPARPELGLSSDLNRTWMLRILHHSLPHEVDAVLAEARYRPAGGPARPGGNQPAVERVAENYLRSEAGQKHLAKRKDELIAAAAERELATEAGRRRIEEVKARLLARSVAEDVDAFSRLCRDEVRRQVERWLQSPQGRETLEFAKRRAVGPANMPSDRSLKWGVKPLPQGVSHDEADRRVGTV